MNRSTRSALLAVASMVLVAGALEAQAAPAAAKTATRAAPRSWTSDRRAFVEGDVISVMIDEQTMAAALTGTSSSSSRFRDMSLGAGQTIAAGLPDIGADLSSSDQANSSSSGNLTRENRFQAEITVRVVGIEPNGLLQIEGKKSVNVDKNTEELTLTGFVRPQDISIGNLVDSWRLADPQLVYTSSGLGSPKSGIISKLLGALWP